MWSDLSPITDDEKQEKQFDAQIQMQQAQIEMGEKAEPARAKEGEEWKPFDRSTNYRTLLAKIPESELDEVEALVKAVESAPHQNGEIKALNKKLFSYANRRKYRL